MLLVLIDIVILTSFTVYEAIGHHRQFVKTPNKEQIERTTGVSFYACKVGAFLSIPFWWLQLVSETFCFLWNKNIYWCIKKNKKGRCWVSRMNKVQKQGMI